MKNLDFTDARDRASPIRTDGRTWTPRAGEIGLLRYDGRAFVGLVLQDPINTVL